MFYTIEYITLFIYISLSFLLVLLLLGLTSRISPLIPLDNNSMGAYECGFDPYKDAYDTIDPHFFLIGLLFIVFDLELIFIYPWAIKFFYLTNLEYFSMFIFILIVNAAFIYEWLVDALSWIIQI